MQINFPLQFNMEFFLADGSTLVQTHDGQVYRKPLPNYNSDGLTVHSKNVDFLNDENFVKAYQAGMSSGHIIGGGGDLHIEWRVHVCLWAAVHACKLEGDFVECGVNTGMYSLAIMNYLNFNKLQQKFFLFDTFEGIPLEQISGTEESLGRVEHNNSQYFNCYELAKENFAPFSNAILVKGKVPDTLNQVNINKVSYLSIDMNIVEPEIAAGNFFWDKLVSGAIIVLDDYGWLEYFPQKEAWDQFAQEKGVKILNLPTGQGLIIKP
jgi:O-methyltransferase